jgi:uncharacterized delta-60 repeat protein
VLNEIENAMKTPLLLLSVFSSIFFSASLSAQDGSLDNSFDADGKLLTEFGNYHSSVSALALQPDGKIIAAGATYNTGDYHQLALARYLADGALDPAFGVGGKVVSDFPGIKLALSAILVQPDNKILGAGIIYNNYYDSQAILIRYNSDGTVDMAFGSDGIVITDNANINAIMLQPDGKILAAGFTFENPSDKDMLVVRYNDNGTIDATFGNSGRTTSSIGNRDFIKAMALQPDGKIVVAGYVYTDATGYATNYCLARYDANGTLDSSFGAAGMIIMDINESDESSAVKIQPDGKIIFTGLSSNLNSESYTLTRLMPDGSMDLTFGNTGMISGDYAGMGKCLALQADGKIILAGSAPNGGSHMIGLTRFNENGTTDANFGNNGSSCTQFMSSSKANALLIQSDSKLVIGGEAGPTTAGYKPDFALARYVSGSALGVSQTSFDASFAVYPNPVKTKAQLEINLLQSENLSVDLYDITGKKIKSFFNKKDFSIGNNTYELDLPETLQSGIYFVRISNGRSSSTVRIVK